MPAKKTTKKISKKTTKKTIATARNRTPQRTTTSRERPYDPTTPSSQPSKTLPGLKPWSSEDDSIVYKNLNLYPDLPVLYPERECRFGVRITRTMADEWMTAKFEGQRDIAKAKVRRFISKMQHGAWEDTSQPILLDIYGRLIDGQHRLEAFRSSGLEEIKMTVIVGVPPKVFPHLDEDVGVRTVKDLLYSSGCTKSRVAASAIRMMLAYALQESLPPDSKSIISFGHYSPAIWKDDPKRVLRWWSANAEIVDHVATICTVKGATKEMLSPLMLFTGFYLWVAVEDQDKADAFFAKLIHGHDMGKMDPIRHLRQELAEIRARAKDRSLTPSYVYGALIIKAWNAYIRGASVTKLEYGKQERWPQRGSQIIEI